MQAIFETVFDILYLITVILLGVKMIKGSQGRGQYTLYGIMAVILGFGDAFHLIPRAVALSTTGLADYTALLGIGKMITSVTMTIFYVILYYVWCERYQMEKVRKLTAAVWGLALTRILLCLMPQNQWMSSTPPLCWGIYRNIPFLLLGLLILLLFYKKAKEGTDHKFAWLWLTIVLSFTFYIPVVLFADSFPLLGMLMIPKTCAYVWMVVIGYQAMKEDLSL